MFTESVEPIFNSHPHVFRTALVGVGPPPQQTPVLIVELEGNLTRTSAAQTELLRGELQQIGSQFAHTRSITTFLFHPSLPVDVRHNVKINREELAKYAEQKLR